MNQRNNIIVIVVVAIFFLCCCLLVGGSLAAGYFVFQQSTAIEVTSEPWDFYMTRTPEAFMPEISETPEPDQPVNGADDYGGEADSGAYETLKTLQEVVVPNNDLRELSGRFKNIQDIPETVAGPSQPYKVGDRQDFWANNSDTNENFKVSAQLKYITPHLYFWIETGVNYDEGDLKDLAETFEKKIYPTNREFFGSEWTPGIDNDPHLYILFARGIGDNIAGYFSSADEVHPLAHEYSNTAEMFVLNADNVLFGEEFTYGVLAHEFQHMIHWYRDRNEESWLNEGFSELAAFLNGYDIGGFDYSFMADPDLQLNDWPNDPDATTPHYGAGFMFVTYFLDRFGEKATQSLVSHVENGMESVDAVLSDLNISDPLNGGFVSADQLFGDWVVANYLKDPTAGDGRYVYKNYAASPSAPLTEEFYDCPIDWQDRSVKQYGADYIRIACEGGYTLSFQGMTTVGVLPEDAHSGKKSFWSNKGDESDMSLTKSFDFSQVSGPITFKYWIWNDLEEDYDYAYLLVSEDGTTWKILDTPSCTSEDPSGNSYGCGWNATQGWREEFIDLSAYAGKNIQLRFEYITDAAVNGEGLLLDDISIPEINYSTDFENDNGGWEPAGFVRIENQLPQTFVVSLIKEGGEAVVERISLNSDQSFQIPLEIGNDVSNVTIVVSGTTRFTRQEAYYRFKVEP